MIFSKKLNFLFFILLIFIGGFFYFRSQVYYSHGNLSGKKTIEIAKGDGSRETAEKLYLSGVISGRIFFFYYLKMNNLENKIMPRVYEFSEGMTIPEVVRILTSGEEKFIKITFPEGWDARKMAARLTENGLSGDEFLKLVENPQDFKTRYSYLSSEKVTTLEGYLFPDTYYFKKDTETSDIVGRLLDTFDERLDETMRRDTENSKRTIQEVVTMASITEREVQTADEMKIVSGIFWKRIDAGDRLQSDATLSYFLNDKEDQHSGSDLEIDTPYNSYRYAGLPPTPIGNPGKKAISSAIYPTESPYYFFLTVSENGAKKVIYSKTFEEHVANRQKYGL